MRVCLTLIAFGACTVARSQASGDALVDGFQTPPRDTSGGARVMTSPGFSHTGDASVQPLEAMKKLVWTVTSVAGGQPVSDRLAAPPDNSGPFQNITYRDESPWTEAIEKTFYQDVAVIAYKVAEPSLVSTPAITSSAGPVDAARLSANDPAHPFPLPSRSGGAWIQFDYPVPQTLRSATLRIPEMRVDMPMVVDVQALDGGRYRHVSTIDMRSSVQATVSFPAVTSRSFRLVFTRRPLDFQPIVPFGGSDVVVAKGAIPFFKIMRDAGPDFPVVSLSLRADGRINAFERKAGFFTFVNDYYALATPADMGLTAVHKADVIDLTGRLRADGSLDWTPPAGRWEILRLGYSLTGQVSHPPGNGSGLEADKLSFVHMRNYLNRWLDGAIKPGAGRGTLFSDSIEAGPQNWTDDMLAEFTRRRGYDARPFIPALTGVIVESPAISDKFLWDYRQTISELIEEATYKAIADIGHARGMQVAIEALETGRHNLGDDFEFRRYADLPMGAIWGGPPPIDYLKDYPNQVADLRGASSVAHFFGRPIIGVESGTDLEHPGYTSPRALKPMVDLGFALGVNSLAKGGSPQDPWGAWSAEWVRYQARTSFLLQQGKPVVDVAYFYGQEGPMVSLRERAADTPKANAFDFVNDKALQQLEVRDGMLVAPGLRYRVLQLGGSSKMMTTSVLRRLKILVESGATVVGAAPIDTPSLADDPAEFTQLKATIWGAGGKGGKLGQGRVLAGTVDQALASLGVGPDLAVKGYKVGTDVLFQHRQLTDGDVYFVVSRSEKGGPVEMSFRQTGKVPELWRADTGARAPLPYRMAGGRTLVPLDLTPDDALFVVFRKATTVTSLAARRPAQKTIATIEGDWQVSFPGLRNAPAKNAVLRTGSWTASSDADIKYFSGAATYTRAIDIAAGDFSPGDRIFLSLGEVRELADVSVNGVKVGVRLSPPYRFDITDAVKPGANQIEIKVANLAANRMIGAKQPGQPAGPAPGGFGLVEFKPDAPLRPSGIIGPVTLVRERL
jgi:alpha-L-rhamnosidase